MLIYNFSSNKSAVFNDNNGQPKSSYYDNANKDKGGEGQGDSLLLFDKKIALATEGLIPFFERLLRQRASLKENTLIICDYIIAAKRDINLSAGHTISNIRILVALSKFHSSNKKNFKEMTREDVMQ
jgi:hypothetical protein